MMSKVHWIILVFCACILAGCMETPLAGAPMSAAAFASPSVDEPSYILDAGDRLRIVVYGQDGLTNSYTVSANGNIVVPLMGSVTARGKTLDGLARKIGESLRDGFIREPHIAIEVEAYRPFFILGEVTFPGQYPYVPNLTAEKAVAIAGGFTPRAFRSTVQIDRKLQNGRRLRESVPLFAAVRPGDTVHIEERWF
jgi:polysaccharide export outer membrane protein